YLFVQRDSKE
nr:Chain C, synthetic N-end rule peptide [synthetic construct]3DNJ_D Chain D, synthetic N-end rule peptide [synthetic construct]